MSLVALSRQVAAALRPLQFGPPVTHVYRVLDYASVPHEEYLTRYGRGRKRVLLFGMNPGPFGMVQTGVPFGDVASVRDWLGIEGPVGKPEHEHPKRPVFGFACPRREVSGQRLWGFAESRFGTAQSFFEEFFVINYCALAFLEHSGANRTPDKLPRLEQQPLLAVCDAALRAVVEELEPEFVIGIGSFALGRAQKALHDYRGVIGTILHPSPASPAANRNWAETAEAQLRALGVPVP